MSAVASGVRLRWPDLPPGLRSWAQEVIGGGPVVAHHSQPGGFSPGTADRVRTADGRRAFVKAVSVDQNPDSPGLHRREGEVVAQLPPTVPVPRLLGRYDDGRWVALVFEEVAGRTPPVPWRGADVDAALAALAALADELTPPPVAGLGEMSEDFRDSFAGWARIRADRPAGLDSWAVERLDVLVELAAEGLESLRGDTLVHADVRADNLLVGPDGRVTVVDWPWACRGAAWVDRLLLLVNVDLYGGLDVEALVTRHLDPLTPPGTVTSVLAGLSGYFTDAARQPAVAGLPTLRAFQAAQSASTSAWLRRRLAGPAPVGVP